MYYFNPHSIPHIIAAFLSLCIALFVYTKNTKSETNISFFILAIAATMWKFGDFMLLNSSDPKVALMWCKNVYLGTIFISISTYYFSVSFLHLKSQKKYILPLYLIGALVWVPLSRTNFFVIGVREYYWGYWYKSNILFLIYLVFFGSVMLFSFYNFYLGFKTSESPLERTRIKYMFIAFMIAYVGCVDYLPNYGIPIYPFGHTTTTIYIFLLAYAILRYRLMDIEVVIRETAVFAGIFGFAVGAFVIVMNIGQVFLEPYVRNYPLLFPAIALFLVTIAVRPIEKLTYNTIGKLLFKKRQEYQKTLKDAAEGMATVREPEKLFGLITHIVSKHLNPNNTSVYIFDDAKETYQLQAARYPTKINKDIKFKSQEPVISWLKENKQPLVLEEIDHWLKEEQTRPHKEVLASDLLRIKEKLASLNASICIPSFIHDVPGRKYRLPEEKAAIQGESLVGLLILADKKSGDLYTYDDLELLDSLADEAAIAIRNSILYKKLQQKAEEVIQIFENEQVMFVHAATAFANAIDARDPYTHGHSQRVTNYCLALMDQMEETKFESRERYIWFKARLRLAGLLHDIGKIATPDYILQKTGTLNDEEWKKMREHPVVGAEVLSYVRGLWDIMPAVRHHHERYDGRGYPEGLKQEDIPFMARIMAVADTFDAMTSDRPYRKALEAEAAKQEINNNSAAQFDPYAVGAFMKAYAKGLIIEIMRQNR